MCAACLIWAAAACSKRPLLRPVQPLVPTPELEFRQDAPPISETVPQPPPIAQTQLPNGVKVVTALLPGSPYAEVLVAAKHGIPSSSAELWAAAIAESERASLDHPPLASASAGDEWAVLRWRCEPDRVQDALDAARVALTKPPSQSAIDAAQRQRTDAARKDSVDLRVAFRAHLSRARPGLLDRPAAGAALGDFQPHFDPAEIVIAVAGDVQPDAIRALVTSRLGDIARAPSSSGQVAPPRSAGRPTAPTASSVFLLERSVPTPVVAVGFEALPLGDPEALVDDGLVMHALWHSIVERQRILWGVPGVYAASEELGFFVVELRVDAGQIPGAIRKLGESVEQMRSRPSPEAWTSARQVLTSYIALEWRRPPPAASLAWSAALSGTPERYASAVIERLETIDDEKLRAHAERMLAQPTFVVFAAGPVVRELKREHPEYEPLQ